MNDIATIESSVIEIGPDTPTERIAQVRNDVKFFGQEARRVSALLDKMLIERIEATGEDIVISDTCRLYVGHPPEYKVNDPRKLVETLLSLGELDVLARCLSSGAFKAGACRTAFEEIGHPELFDVHFETKKDATLEEGKPKRGKLIEDNGFVQLKLAGRAS